MKSNFSRRDFLKVSGLALGSLAFSPSLPSLANFDDSSVVRIATAEVAVRSKPSDEGLPVGRYTRNELVHVYQEVTADEPAYNPVWYRVWGGYIHRGRVQRVRTIFQKPINSIPEGTRWLAEVTVPLTMPYRYTKAYAWQPLDNEEIDSQNPPLYYQSVHWVDGVQAGPDGEAWYRIFDELDGRYFVPAMHMRPIPLEMFDPISPQVPPEQKRIEVNLTTQRLMAYEYDKVVFQTNISSGIPGGGVSGDNGISTTTPDGNFEITDKYPSKHMGYSYFSSYVDKDNLLADADGYVLAGVPWTSFIASPGKETAGVAFHGTYWHDNFGINMSHGCINMRSNEANWIFRWVRPPHTTSAISNNSTSGTRVEIHY